MENTEIGASTTDILGAEYQAFLSYKVADTGPGFTNSIYHALVDAGVHVFLDNKELPMGKNFMGSLSKALNDSQIYIPIFSKNYASSSSCLDECAEMVENTSKSKEGVNEKVILPIYYDVKSDDVMLRTELYEKAISELEGQNKNSFSCFGQNEKKFSTEKFDKWRRALRECGEIQASRLKDFKGHGHLSKHVVEEVLRRLSIKRRAVTKDLVGMEDHKAAINKFLDTRSGGEFQLLLSLIDPDAQRIFATTLYRDLDEAGLLVVINNDETEQLKREIDHSKIYIPIFPREFRPRRQFGKELVRMVENTKEDSDEKAILPIFYDSKLVSPAKKLKSKAALILRGWNKKERQALREVSGLTERFILKDYMSAEELSKSVVNEAVDRLRKERSEDVRIIGIYGMAGIGKSTLAKEIFNEQYPRFKKYCSFLDDVSEMAKTKGLVELQKLLLSDLSNSRVARNIVKADHGINMIGDTICNKKVLIVLDDVDDVNQIQGLIGVNSLCPGTRILITTRDKRVLQIRGFKYEIEPYEMKGLSYKDALELFSRHVFDREFPPDDYDTLSKDIVSIAGGLPLAIEAIGSSLFLQKEQKIWEEKLKKTPNWDVLRKLRISYDALEMDQQQIFLDIACFFIGENKIDPIYMWRDCGFRPEDAIDVLISKCMIKVTDDNRFSMHNQFRHLGRAIATQERSRLWAKDDVICELKSTEMKRSVQALCLQSDLSSQSSITVTSEQIIRFPYLRFLRFSHVTCQGEFTGCLSNLKWISVRYPGAYPFLQGERHHLENVVVVNLFGLTSTDDSVSSLIMGARKLKVLTLQECDLQTLEGLRSHLTVLELLRSQVKEVTLDGLAQLEKLTVEGCELLESLSIPSTLTKLREVKVSSCPELVEVKFLGGLTSMEILCIEDCESFERLEKLKNLENLKDLSIKGCQRLQVPTLQESDLPTGEGLPSNLSVLELSCITGEQVTLDGLAQMEKLTVERCDLKRLSIPSSLRKLREVKVSSCPELVEVQFLGFLRLMEILCIEDCKSLERLENLKNLQNLKDLGIKESDLQTLEGLPSNLTVLQLSRTQVKQVKLDGLAQLEKLTVDECELLESLSIPSSLRKLREVKVSSCAKLVEVELPDVLSSMEILCIENCEYLKNLRSLKNLENLKDLGLKGCESLQVLPVQECDLQSFEGLPSNLTVLKLSRILGKLVPLDGLARLEKLTVEECDLKSLSIPSRLRKLREVKVSSCPELVEVQFLGVLRAMEILCIEDCQSLKNLKSLMNLKNLKDLSIKGCENLQVAEGIDELKHLQWLKVKGCTSMEPIIDASSSKIPNKCEISITDCKEFLNTGPDGSSITWESYREKILTRPEAGDPPSEQNQPESATEQGERVREG